MGCHQGSSSPKINCHKWGAHFQTDPQTHRMGTTKINQEFSDLLDVNLSHFSVVSFWSVCLLIYAMFPQNPQTILGCWEQP